MTKKQQKLVEIQDSELTYGSERLVSRQTPPIVKVRFSEWIFSSFILFIMVLLFTELSREKFQNQVMMLTAKGYVDLGYRIFFLAVTMILLGGIFSLFSWGKNRIRDSSSGKDQISWPHQFFNIGIKIGIKFDNQDKI